MSARGWWFLAAVFLVSGVLWAGAQVGFPPIGAWFPGMQGARVPPAEAEEPAWGEGAGAAASAEVAPAGGPGPVTPAADPVDRQVELTWTEAAPNGAEVKLYRYRYRTASGWTGPDWHRVAGQGAARDTTLTGLSNGTLCTFEVRATTGRATASPTRRPPSR